jgi:hypothetical protein
MKNKTLTSFHLTSVLVISLKKFSVLRNVCAPTPESKNSMEKIFEGAGASFE